MNKCNYWYWEGYKDFKKLNNFIDKNFDDFEHKGKADQFAKKSSVVKTIYYRKIKHMVEGIVENCIQSARLNFGYEVDYPAGDDSCNLNIYPHNNLDAYEWHVDESRNPFQDIKLTVLINLSVKKYEGGDFYLWKNEEEKVEPLNTPGNILMFKSYINHKVSPVTKGERRTLTIFLMGPAFK